ncbi:MAG TPA: serine hydrolase domain-containing protein [Bryobacteraceae bacterium]
MFSLKSLVFALAAWPLTVSAQPALKPEDAGMSTERLKRIHESIQRHVDAGEISGAVTVVARRGRVVHFEAHGLMDLESKKPMEKDAIFRLASMTKPITGVAVLMMVEEGKIRLNDPVSKFLPVFRDMKVALPRERAAGPAVPAASAEPDFYLIPANREITIRDLLTHTSGLVSGGLGAAQVPKLAPRGPADTLASYVPKLAAVPLDFQPGTQWAYSGGAGPDTLSRIVEIVSGQTYDEFLRTRIFEPLGMKDTFFYPPDGRRPRLVTLYRKTPTGLEKDANQDGFSSKTYFSGGGGLMSTAADYLHFAQMLLNGGELDGKRLLSPRTVELMASNHVGDMFNGKLGRPAHGMGFGLIVQVVEDNVAAGLRVSNGSFGWDGAFGTQVWVNPKERMVTLVMIQTQVPLVQRDFENAVMQAIVD